MLRRIIQIGLVNAGLTLTPPNSRAAPAYGAQTVNPDAEAHTVKDLSQEEAVTRRGSQRGQEGSEGIRRDHTRSADITYHVERDLGSGHSSAISSQCPKYSTQTQPSAAFPTSLAVKGDPPRAFQRKVPLGFSRAQSLYLPIRPTLFRHPRLWRILMKMM